MARSDEHRLTRRERQIMDALYAGSPASVAEVRERLPDAPSYSAVRTMLGILVEKGFVKHRAEGTKYQYSPVRARKSAAKDALQRVVETFFGGSPERAVAALIDSLEAAGSEEEWARIEARIEEARRRRER